MEKVRFICEVREDGVQVQVEGRPETSELIPKSTIVASPYRAAYGYTDKHVGPKEKVGAKGGSLGNKLTKLLDLGGRQTRSRETVKRNRGSALGKERRVEMPKGMAQKWVVLKLAVVETLGPFKTFGEASAFNAHEESPLRDGERFVVEGVYEEG